ncbi:MAG: MFS transporter [Promethearchaeota archaeon]|nr:MAG: MFS transporter [Candidatus Lokiarchaeota archaeon]
MSEHNDNSGSTWRSRQYLIYLLFILILVQILDTYTQFYLNAIPSEVKKSFLSEYSKNVADSIFAIAVAIATLGSYVAFFVWYLADRIGRKTLLLATVFGLTIGSIGIFLSRNIVEYTIFYFVIWTFGISDVWLMYINEEAPADKKGFWTNIILVGGMIGSILIPIFRAIFVTETSPTGSWKGMTFFPIFLGIPLGLIILLTIKETSKYEELKSKNILENIEKRSFRESIKTLFKIEHKTSLYAVLILFFIRYLNYFSIYLGEIILSETLGFNAGQIAVLLAVMSISTVLGYVTAGKLSDKYGRRPILYILTIMLNIASLIWLYVLFLRPIPTVAFVLIIIAVSFNNIAFYGLWTFLSIITLELVPTEARGTGSGFKTFVGAFANTLGLVLTSIITLYLGLVAAFIIFGFFYLLNYPIIYKYLVETKGIDLSKVE